jgi:hypothetical protein
LRWEAAEVPLPVLFGINKSLVIMSEANDLCNSAAADRTGSSPSQNEKVEELSHAHPLGQIHCKSPGSRPARE